MDKRKRGSAYIMVVFVSFPLLLAALTAFAVSINSRNISARHSDFFGMYELASAANTFAILVFEEAYLANREGAHRKTILHFEELLYDDYEECEICLADYHFQYRSFLLAMIWTHLEDNFDPQGNVLTREFEIILGKDHAFCGTISITQVNGEIRFTSEVTMESHNIVPMRAQVRGVVRWPAPAAREVRFSETYQIKNLDYFTPWVVELKKL